MEVGPPTAGAAGGANPKLAATCGAAPAAAPQHQTQKQNGVADAGADMEEEEGDFEDHISEWQRRVDRLAAARAAALEAALTLLPEDQQLEAVIQAKSLRLVAAQGALRKAVAAEGLLTAAAPPPVEVPRWGDHLSCAAPLPPMAPDRPLDPAAALRKQAALGLGAPPAPAPLQQVEAQLAHQWRRQQQPQVQLPLELQQPQALAPPPLRHAPLPAEARQPLLSPEALLQSQQLASPQLAWVPSAGTPALSGGGLYASGSSGQQQSLSSGGGPLPPPAALQPTVLDVHARLAQLKRQQEQLERLELIKRQQLGLVAGGAVPPYGGAPSAALAVALAQQQQHQHMQFGNALQQMPLAAQAQQQHLHLGLGPAAAGTLGLQQQAGSVFAASPMAAVAAGGALGPTGAPALPRMPAAPGAAPAALLGEVQLRLLQLQQQQAAWEAQRRASNGSQGGALGVL
eukprot:scaffold10.g2451.t1